MTYRREGRKTFDGTTAEQEKEQSMGEQKEGAKQNEERKVGRKEGVLTLSARSCNIALMAAWALVSP